MDIKLLEILKNYFKSAPISRAWIFGSFSRGEESPKSDLDILVELNKGAKLGFGFFKMARDLETISGRNVDLVECNMIDPHIVPFVNKDRILIYER